MFFFLFFSFTSCFPISGLLPFAAARGAEHPGLERGRAREGRETVAAAPRERIGLCPPVRVHLLPEPSANTASFTFPAWGRGGAGRGRAGARAAAFRAFQPPDSSRYRGCEPGVSKNSS